ncbi:MAG: hypothetical protein HQL41_04150 [Alphaproteobacteria bacterium]|nr:hypothetical protein [Alphaproteobacteria bacterium]
MTTENTANLAIHDADAERVVVDAGLLARLAAAAAIDLPALPSATTVRLMSRQPRWVTLAPMSWPEWAAIRALFDRLPTAQAGEG